MRSLIFRTVTPLLVSLMIIYSIFVLFRGHNEPGGGFIGGLIAASAFALLGFSMGAPWIRRAMRVPPMAVAGVGVFISATSGLVSALFGEPFLTGKWYFPDMNMDVHIPISTPVMFDIGVWLVVVGTIVAITTALSDRGGDED